MTPPVWILPDWPAPPNIHARQTTRVGGVSQGAFRGWNLADHVGDDPLMVAQNRALLQAYLPTMPHWLNQMHGTRAVWVDQPAFESEADAALSSTPHVVCGVMTADCLPVLLCNDDGNFVAAIHAGWRGLLRGVIEETICASGLASDCLMAWLGSAIGPDAFEVGNEVYQAFVTKHRDMAQAFMPVADFSKAKWLADIYELARQTLAIAGITRIYGGGACTYHDAAHYFSYRRDNVTGRMATLIWFS